MPTSSPRVLLLTALLLMCAVDVDAQQLNAKQSKIDTLLVCAPDLLAAAKPWIEYRTQQGHQIGLVSGRDSKADIKRAIRTAARQSDLKFVVIMGDAPAGERKLGTHVETDLVESDVIRRWGAEPTFVSDNDYADLDADGAPDLAIGRISADSAEQLTAILNKTMAYERSQNFGSWRRRVNFVAGVGGFGLLADKVLETAAKKFITDGIPPEYNTSMTQASWRSVYSPDPRLFQAQTIERLNEGCLAWVYLGHGRIRGLDYYRVPDGGLPIMSAEDVPQISARQGAPIAVFLSCYTGAFDAEPDCLAEALLMKPGGPVAVIAGANVTMPYAMTIMGNAMLRELFEEQRATIGEVVLHAKQELAKQTEAQPKGLINQLAKVMSPNPELLDEERAEHIRLFQLLGDPLIRIRHPKSVEINVPEYGTSGTTLEIRGTSEVDGPCVIELVCRRDRTTLKAPRRPKFERTDEWLRSLQETYNKANDTAWCAVKQTIRNGQFSASLEIPEQAKGLAHVRVYVRGKQAHAMGASDIYLRPPLAEAKAND